MIDRVKDPVCGMEIRLDRVLESTLFEGERVCFCGASCYAAFRDVPHRYRGWASDRGRRHSLGFRLHGRPPVATRASAH